MADDEEWAELRVIKEIITGRMQRLDLLRDDFQSTSRATRHALLFVGYHY